jgi:hypothetical protein
VKSATDIYYTGFEESGRFGDWKMIVRDATNDRDYYIERAREERAWAGQCAEPTAALAHLKLAVQYEKRALREAMVKYAESDAAA